MTTATTPLSAAAYLNVVAFLINLTANFLPAPVSIGELSEKYQTLITPSGYAFSIWSIIFLAEAQFCVAQFLPSFRSSPLIEKGIGWNFIFANLFQAGWVFAFSWFENIWLSMICMAGIFIFLTRIIWNQYHVSQETRVSKREFWLLKFPVTIHFGWISVATLVNINIVLLKSGANAMTMYLVGLACLALIPVAGSLLLFQNVGGGYVIPSVYCWATFAIYNELGEGSVKDLIVNTFSAQQIEYVRWSALGVCIMIGAAILFKLTKTWLASRTPSSETDRLTEHDHTAYN